MDLGESRFHGSNHSGKSQKFKYIFNYLLSLLSNILNILSTSLLSSATNSVY